MYKRLFLILLILALASMACSININLPVYEITTGELQTEDILVPALAESPAVVTLSFGAGYLKVSPGAGDAVIQGVANYNVKQFKPQVTVEGKQVRISTGDLEITGLPRLRDELRNDWDLKVGNGALSLRISAGAYKGEYELGGLSLNELRVADGAAEVKMNFNSLNQVEMSEFRYETGASTVRLSGLANANFRKMTFKSGAGAYTLDFTGKLQQDASVVIESGVSQVTIIVPTGTAARVSVSGLSNVDVNGAWQKTGSVYETPGSGALIDIQIQMGAGNINLRNTP